MIVIAKNNKDEQYHIYFNVEEIEFLDEFYDDKDVALLSKTEEIYEDGGSRSKSKLLNKDYKIITIQKDPKNKEELEIIEELAHKDKFVIHRDFL